MFFQQSMKRSKINYMSSPAGYTLQQYYHLCSLAVFFSTKELIEFIFNILNGVMSKTILPLVSLNTLLLKTTLYF